MALKKSSNPGSRLSLRIFGYVFGAVLVFFSSPLAKGEAASDLLGRYTCSQAKKLIETDPLTIFDMWLDSGGYFGGSK